MPFRIIRNDITQMQVDAIVNTANAEPIYSYGIDSAVYHGAGEEQLLAARKEIGRMEEGEVAITPGFDLPTKYIIHAVSPRYIDGKSGEEEKLRACYERSLQLALENRCESIAFPLIATGSFGYPKEEGMQIALGVIHQFLMTEEMTIYLVVFDAESFALTGKVFENIDEYIDEHYVARKSRAEYSLQAPRWEDAQESASLMEYMDSSEDMVRPRPMINAQQANIPPVMTTMKAAAGSAKKLDDVVKHIGETFAERLFRLIDEREMTDAEVYKKANLDRKLFSKIRCNPEYHPKKSTALALAIALELNLDETKDLLSRAGLALSPSSLFDVIIQYFIEQEVYDIYAINLALFKHGQPTLGE